MSTAEPRVLVIVPAYEEAGSVGEVVGDILANVPGSDVVVVDDGSGDDTSAVARDAGARVLRLPFNLGVGGAMRTGFQLAVEDGADAVVQVDADGQHPPAEIPRLLAPVLSGETDVAIGTRYLTDTGYKTPVSRRLGQWFFSRLVRFLTGRSFSDTTSGFRAYNRESLAFVARHYSRDYPEVNALVSLARNGFRIREIPVTMRGRAAGASHITILRAVYYMCKVPLASFMSAARQRENPKR